MKMGPARKFSKWFCKSSDSDLPEADEPSVPGDEVALKTGWKQLGRGNSCSTKLQLQVNGATGKAYFTPTYIYWLFNWIMIGFGLIMLVFRWFTAGIGLHCLVTPTFGVSFIVPLFWLVFIVPRVWLCWILRKYRIVFDFAVDKVHMPGNPGEVMEVADIHALQLLCRTGRCFSRCIGYELNLVLKNGSRRKLIDGLNLVNIRANARELARKLKVPVWELGPNGEVAVNQPDLSVFGDCTALKSGWEPMSNSGNYYESRAIIDKDRLKARIVMSAKEFIIPSIVFATGAFTVSLSFYFMPAACLLGGAGGLLAVSALVVFFYRLRPSVIDFSNRSLTKRWVWTPVELFGVHALQLLAGSCNLDMIGNRVNVEMNLVFDDGSRISLANYGSVEKARRDAAELSGRLGIKVWEYIWKTV
ncbi:MAG: hypothetical protein VB042_06035 [Victivallaceae bacterium]|nr:hypothetical protein [Victivallaceae bacterium]